MKIVKLKPKTIIKLILFLIVIAGFLYVIFQSGESDQSINVPTAPAVPTEEEEPAEETETPDEQQPEVEQPEQVVADVPTAEERPETIASKQQEIDGHSFFMENNFLELYLNEENLSLIVREKATGAVMYSTVKEPIERN
ncbi:hypothetical protein F9U64_16705 [Gracilibacillus oryzae]|uniref:Uncharacterized protein n=1 Tax=Gracilibacillus oryzae TaxID=1672701 RepID=A0A7C8KXL3_9BACI|nr:hypothetical protein [Gracilibacillus oryzae]KAB8128060.1 hypothetical protein F9U64_16705 [Gracilibacillus oryzae]